MRSSHVEKPRKDMYEHSSCPGSHGVGLRCPEVNIKHANSHTYTEVVHIETHQLRKHKIYPHLNVSKIIVKRTNFPKSGTTSEVGGMISASSRKNTVRDSKMLMDKLTYQINIIIYSSN